MKVAENRAQDKMKIQVLTDAEAVAKAAAGIIAADAREAVAVRAKAVEPRAVEGLRRARRPSRKVSPSPATS